MSRSPWITSVGSRAPRSSWSRVFSGRPGGCSGKASARQPAAPRSRAQRAAERAPAERPPTTSGALLRSRSAAAVRPASRVGGRRRHLAAGDLPGLLEQHHGDPVAGQVRARGASRSRAPMPPPAPWLSSSVADGLPCPVGDHPAVAVRGRDDRLVRHRAPHSIASDSGIGSTSSGPLLRTLLDHRRDGEGLQPAGRGRHQQRQQVVLRRDGGVEPGVPPVRLDHQRHPVVDVADGVLGLGGQHRARPAEPVRARRRPWWGRARSRRAPPWPGVPPSLGRMKNGCLSGLPALRLLGRGVPLEVAVGRQQAAAHRERLLVRRLLGDGLHPGVDHPVADRGVLRPGRDQPPGEHPQLALGRLLGLLRRRPLDDGVHLLGGRDVVVGGSRGAGIRLSTISNSSTRSSGRPARRVATAHGVRLRERADGQAQAVSGVGELAQQGRGAGAAGGQPLDPDPGTTLEPRQHPVQQRDPLGQALVAHR